MTSLANTKSAQRTLITLEGIIRRKLCEEYLFAPRPSIGHSASNAKPTVEDRTPPSSTKRPRFNTWQQNSEGKKKNRCSYLADQIEIGIFSPIAISLGSYMDKAAGRRPCTGKIFTQDVSVLSRSCLGLVSVMSRSCLGRVSVMSRSCLGLVSVMSRSCLGRVWVMSRSCLGDVSVMSRSCLGRVSVMSRSCLGFSPIAISLGSYMDKAARRRPCTGKKFTQDVSVLSR